LSSTTINERVSALETRADDMDARADAMEARGEAIQGRTAAMETRQGAVEAKVTELHAFAGPGQNQALSDNVIDVRKKLDLVLKNQEKFGERQVALEAGQQALVDGQRQVRVGLSLLEDKVTWLQQSHDNFGERLTAVEEGQVRLQEGQVRLQEGQVKLEQRQVALEQGQGEIKATLVQILDRLPAKPGNN
jgi:predicted nuclease with TOPRIM domain